MVHLPNVGIKYSQRQGIFSKNRNVSQNKVEFLSHLLCQQLNESSMKSIRMILELFFACVYNDHYISHTTKYWAMTA